MSNDAANETLIENDTGHIFDARTIIEKNRIEDERILEKLKNILTRRDSPDELSDKEIEKIRNMIAVYESFQAFGRFAASARRIVLFLGSLLLGWFVLFDNFKVIIGHLASILGVK